MCLYVVENKSVVCSCFALVCTLRERERERHVPSDGVGALSHYVSFGLTRGRWNDKP